MTAKPRFRCHTCGAEFTAWAKAERHADAEHHHRVDLVVAVTIPDRLGGRGSTGVAAGLVLTGRRPRCGPQPPDPSHEYPDQPGGLRP